MISIAIITFSLLLASTSALDLCQYVLSEGAIYSFFGVKAVNISSEYNIDSNGTISFDLCGSSIPACQTYAPGQTDFTATIISDNDQDDCQNIADSRTPTANFIESDNPNAGVSLVFPSISNGNNSIPNTLIVTMTCNNDIDVDDLVWSATVSFNTDGSNTYTLTSNGAPGCPVIQLQNFLAFFQRYYVYFAIFLFVAGFFTLYFGLRFHILTIFLYSTILLSAMAFIIIEVLTGAKAAGTLEWVLFGVCLFIGLVFGYSAVRFPKVGFFAVGAIGGGVGAFFLYSLLLHFINLPEVAMFALIFVLAAVTGLLAMCLWEHIVILVMSFVGAYMTVRSVSFFIGGFPDEISVIEGIEQYNYVDYAYLVIIVIVAISGMVVQYRNKKACKDADTKVESEKPSAKSSEDIEAPL